MIDIKICSGTTCFVMGGTDLFLIKEKLSPEESNKVNITFEPCLGFCKEKGRKPPFVVINGEVYEKIDIDSLISIIKEKIGREKDAHTEK